MQIVSDYLLFDSMPVNLYELPGWLAEEIREVLRIYWNNKAKS